MANDNYAIRLDLTDIPGYGYNQGKHFQGWANKSNLQDEVVKVAKEHAVREGREILEMDVSYSDSDASFNAQGSIKFSAKKN